MDFAPIVCRHAAPHSRPPGTSPRVKVAVGRSIPALSRSEKTAALPDRDELTALAKSCARAILAA